MSLEKALQEHEARVDDLLKAAKRYEAALRGWKRACHTGHVANRQKQAALAQEIAPNLVPLTEETAATWDFDVRAYLDSTDWRQEIQDVAARDHGLRVYEEADTLISSPVVVRAQPGLERLQIGKTGWPEIRPSVVAARLAKLRETSTAGNAPEFLQALYDASQFLTGGSGDMVPFRRIYDLFALTPGWKKENSRPVFAQQIYALHRSGLRRTRAGHAFEFEYPSGKAKERDIFSVIDENGRPIRYYGIWFR